MVGICRSVASPAGPSDSLSAVTIKVMSASLTLWMSRLATVRAAPSAPALAIAVSGSIAMHCGRYSRISDLIFSR
jgi:hypothetical protein